MEKPQEAAALPPMSSYFNQELQLSLEAPSNWVAGSTGEFQLMLMAPPEKEYRANLGFNVRALDPASQAELDKIIRESQKKQADTLADYRLNRDATFMLDNRPTYMRFYEWKDPGLGLHFSQLQALVLVSEDTVYTIDGSSLKELEDKYLPILEHMVSSIRFIALQAPAEE
jgi:hypothetical protein